MGASQSNPTRVAQYGQIRSDPTRVAQYGQIRSDHGAISNSGVLDAIRTTNQSLKPMRAKTAPADDLERERRAISLDARQSLVLVQLALFLTVLALLSYLILPRDWANGISFLLLCVGVASGFFLRR
jgi:hypothetical protein